jgi:hypothetical protein
LLERIIGTSKNAFSVGELKFLKQFLGFHDPGRPYRRQEKFVDASGNKLIDSPFWGDIVKAIKQNGYNVYDRYYKIDKKISLSILLGLTFSTKKYDDFEIFESILKKAKETKGERVEYIIDSSKSLKRLISLKQDTRIDLHVLHNIRDIRGLVASRERNGLDWLKIFVSWLGINFLTSVFLRRFFKRDRVIKLGYDSFASSPGRYIKEINRKFGLHINENTYIKDVNNEVSYVFAGHSMRARKFEGISHDQKWKARLPKWKQGILGLLGAIPNKIWVYKDKQYG